MPLKIDSLSTTNLTVDNQDVNVSSIATSYQKLNKNYEFITVGSEETVIDSILVPASFSCGSLEPRVDFFGNYDGFFENITFKIYLNEKPVLDGNELQISTNNFLSALENNEPALAPQIGSFSFGARFLENLIPNNGPMIGGGYILKDQYGTTVDYITQQNNFAQQNNVGFAEASGGFSIESITTYDCSKQYYAILTASKNHGTINLTSLAVKLNKYETGGLIG